MDLLACPICKGFPLELIVFSEKEKSSNFNVETPACEEYCGLKREKVSKVLGKVNCTSCFKIEIDEAILICPKCERWYPVKEEIPRMLPDDLRNKNEELAFLKEHRGEIPEKTLKLGRPFNIAKP